MGGPGTGNIDEDPLFRDGASGKAGSPCIDSGPNLKDAEKNAWRRYIIAITGIFPSRN
jgi:hypothetical protein